MNSYKLMPVNEITLITSVFVLGGEIVHVKSNSPHNTINIQLPKPKALDCYQKKQLKKN